MKPINYESEPCPTKLQELLLRAVFLSGEDAVQAWQEWKSGVNLEDHLDPGSFRLLPQLYRNLQNQTVEDPLKMKLKGVYRQAWYKNQCLFNNVTTPLSSLRQVGVEILTLYCPDYGLHPIDDFTILVRREQTIEAIKQLRALDWMPVSGLTNALMEIYVSAGYAHLFQNAVGNGIRLHWHVLPECDQVDDDFWIGALETRVHNVPIYTLNPTDQLLYVCVQSTPLQAASLFVRAADAMRVLNTVRSEIDWERLVNQAQKHRLHLPLRNVLNYLQNNLAVSLPPKVLRHLQTMPTSKREQIEYYFKTRRGELMGELPLLWFNYLRRANNINLWQKIVRFSKLIQHIWGVSHFWQIPFYAVIKGMQRIWKMAV